jgi:hypothetical protein
MSTEHLPTYERLKGIFTLDADGNVAIRTMNVVGCSGDALNCGDPRTFDELLAAAIGTNECGKPALRLAQPE